MALLPMTEKLAGRSNKLMDKQIACYLQNVNMLANGMQEQFVLFDLFIYGLQWMWTQ